MIVSVDEVKTHLRIQQHVLRILLNAQMGLEFLYGDDY